MLATWRTILFAATIGLLSFAACKDHPTVAPGALAGLYSYTAYSNTDTVVVTGTITLINSDSTILTGHWALAAVNGATEVGPQTGHGMLRGTTSPGILIGLNPNWVDNNVSLYGTADGEEITGTWHWDTLIGPTGEGRFVMKKL